MAAALPQSDVEVVDDLHQSGKPGEQEEFVDLNVDPAQQQQQQQVQQQEEPQGQQQSSGEEDLPEEYRGKTPAQLAKMLRDAQGVIGRQGSELGDLRKTADIAIRVAGAARGQPQPAAQSSPQQGAQQQQGGQQQAAAQNVDESQFFAKPRETIEALIANHPLIKRIEQTLGNDAKTREIERATQSTERFNTAHPDAAVIMADPEFRTWVNSSRVRAALLRQAHERFDFDAGDEVFGTWKALKGSKQPQGGQQQGGQQNDVSAAARTLANQRRKAQDNAASTPTGGNASGQRQTVKKIYRRADVLNLMVENPKRYEDLAPEIELAYKEGRVR